MNAFAVSFVLITITTLAMAAFSFLKANGRKDVMLWGWVCFSASSWGLGGLIATTTFSYERAYLGWQIANICSIFTPVIFLHFILAYCHQSKKLLLGICYLLAVFFAVINFFFKELFFGKLRFAFNEFYYIDWSKEGGYLYPFFYVFFFSVTILYSFFVLYNEFVHSKGAKRNQIKYLFLTSVIAWLGGHADFLSVFNHSIYPYLNFLIAVYPIIATYAIVRHQLLDISIVLRKGLVYSILVTCITCLYLLLVLASEHFLKNIFQYQNLIASLVTALITALAFIPLKNIIQNFVDARFLKGRPMEIAERNALLMQEVADKEKFKAVATMASGMAHEIKNPLTAIKTFSEYLPLKMNDPEFLQKFSRIVGKEADRINDLVHQLLEFSRPSPPKLEDTSIQNLIDEVLDFLNSQLINYRVKVEKNYQLNGTLLKIDPNQFRQVFLNLFINAIEAMPKGGTLSVATRCDSSPVTREPIHGPRATDHGSRSTQVVITISDTGSGIPPDQLKNLFQPFQTTKTKGTGLGLSISKNIIESHRGKIEVKSNVGEGTKFVIKCPSNNTFKMQINKN